MCWKISLFLRRLRQKPVAKGFSGLLSELAQGLHMLCHKDSNPQSNKETLGNIPSDTSVLLPQPFLFARPRRRFSLTATLSRKPSIRPG